MRRHVASIVRGGFAQQGLELGEDLLDGIEVGRVGRQEEELGAGGGWRRGRLGLCGCRDCP